MNEGGRQKFEAELRAHWMPAATFITGLGYLDLVEKLWQLARAKQPSQTPEVGPSCTVCGVPMIFRCPACGSTPELTGPSQTRAAEPGTCTHCGSFVNKCGHSKMRVYSANCNDGSGMSETHCGLCKRAAAVPVEDRPACPTCSGKKERDTGINWCCKDAFHEDRPAPTPPYDKDCLDCIEKVDHTKHNYGE